MSLEDIEKVRKHMAALQKKEDEERKREIKEGDLTNLKISDLPEEEKQFDSPYAMENGSATLLYIIVMAVGAIFNDGLAIWIVATIIYIKFITRHRKKK
jgi:hypothetical protein